MLTLLAAAIMVGLVLPLQAGINAQLRIGLGSPVLAALVSFSVGTCALILLAIGVRAPLPLTGGIARIPWWQWTGGLLGAGYIAAAVVLAPRLGAATLIAAVVAGQMIASLALDHYGWVGFTQHAISGWRLLGAGLVFVGVVLIQRS